MMHTKAGYKATRDRHLLIVHDVPIFATCFRCPVKGPNGEGPKFDGNFDKAWVQAAADKAMLRFKEDAYKGPLHIGHHELSPFGNGEKPRPAGTYKVVRTKVMQFEGEARLTILADLYVTDPMAQFEMMEDRLPFRSIEIKNLDAEPEINSVALLVTEVPFLRLPNLEISEVVDDDAELIGAGVSIETFSESLEIQRVLGVGPMLACFSDASATFQFRDPQSIMAAKKKTTKKTADDFGKGVGRNFGDHDDKDKDKGADMSAHEGDDDDADADGDDDTAEEGLDFSAFIAAIQSGKISKADWDLVKAAMAEAEAGETQPTNPDPMLAPAGVPGGEAMKDTMNANEAAQFAAFQATLVTQGAEITRLTGAGARAKAVKEALIKLGNRGLGGDLETTLVNFYDEAPNGFTLFVEELHKQNPPLADEGDADSVESLSNVSDLAMNFSDCGKAAVEKVTGFEAQYDWLCENTRPGFTKDEFVTDQMARQGHVAKAV